MLIYITFLHTAFSVLHVVGYTDEEALYCTERNRATAFDESSPYCSIIGMIINSLAYSQAHEDENFAHNSTIKC